jgi:glycosyltransferase involved in cell wall biosynthesis
LQRIWRRGYFRLFGQPCRVDANSEHAPIMTPPLFSILLPSRNRLELLRHAVDSVLGQDADLEIVIADNASDESYSDYISSLGAIAARSVRSKHPLTVTENWNRALAASTGRYVIMMGDDDALVPGWLAKATRLFRQFDEPDALYAMAHHYAYPGVVPSRPEGYLATVNNSELFRTFDQPYLLARKCALVLGEQALRFRHRFSFNSQHFIWNRHFIDSLSDTGTFFQGPYPDYYTSMVTMLAAQKIVVVPTAEVIIGISPKSFGFYYHNAQYDSGQHMLGNAAVDDAWLTGQSDEVRAAVAFPGSAHLRNWLIAALLVARNFRQSGVVDVRRYRRLQILEIVSGHTGRVLGMAERLRLLKPYLQSFELRLLEQLGWLERVGQRLPIGNDVLRNSVGGMGAIYTQAVVTEHDIGEHSSIADAYRWFAGETHAEPAVPASSDPETKDAPLDALTPVTQHDDELDSEQQEAVTQRDEDLDSEQQEAVTQLDEELDSEQQEAVTQLDEGLESEQQEAVIDLPLPILDPLTTTTDGQTIAVVYLARSADGSVSDFEPFITSYRQHDAGIPHDLIIVRKGLHQRSGSQAALTEMLNGIPHRAVDVLDDGFDIQAYLKVTPYLRHDRVCFLNTFSQIAAGNWLRSLNAPLDRGDVGMSGATGSYESLLTSLFFLYKVIWLTSVQSIQYSPKIAQQFRELLSGQAQNWMSKRGSIWMQIKRELARPIFGRPFDTDEIEAGFGTQWETLTRPGAVLFPFRDFRPFPNPHLRSNAFMMPRQLLIDLDFRLDNTKASTNRFESGPDGLPTALAQRGLSSILVGANGIGYEVADWPKSVTFRLGDQANVLVTDNQTRGFAGMSKWPRVLHERMTWGDFLSAKDPKFIDFGVKFPRGSLDLVPSLAEPRPVASSRPDLFYSVIIPTHNRLELLRDALGSISGQSGQNWECVIFDNASDEPVAEYVSSLDDCRIRYERSDEFLPMTASWNRAIDLARGDYVTLIGDDDGLAPNYFEKLADLVATFDHPNVVYSSVYQFLRPAVAPWERAGYVAELRNGFFFQNRSEPFFLNPQAARRAVAGSLTLRRNFGLKMPAFSFSRAFLSQVRTEGVVFHSPLPHYYLATVAMGMGSTIAVSPEPLAIAGVSQPSAGGISLNLEEMGTALLNTKLREDSLYAACEPMLLSGPAYNTSYVIGMEHVARKLGGRAPAPLDYQRYRRLQIFSVITAQNDLYWMRKRPGSLLWAKLTPTERSWALYLGFLNWKAKSGSLSQIRSIDAARRQVEPFDFPPIQTHRVVGQFARLAELFGALHAGTYPDRALPTAVRVTDGAS